MGDWYYQDRNHAIEGSLRVTSLTAADYGLIRVTAVAPKEYSEGAGVQMTEFLVQEGTEPAIGDKVGVEATWIL